MPEIKVASHVEDDLEKLASVLWAELLASREASSATSWAHILGKKAAILCLTLVGRDSYSAILFGRWGELSLIVTNLLASRLPHLEASKPPLNARVRVGGSVLS